MTTAEIKAAIERGDTALGIEFGSTRIKAVLIGPDYAPVASGSHEWENQLLGHIWTYSLDAVWAGLRDCYSKLAQNVHEKYDLPLVTAGSIGFSGMMHGYMAFDKNGELLVPFRTWRNTMTAEASERLTELFGFTIPQRWSVAHLYQAMLNHEEHVSKIDYLVTLAGYIHWQLTGQKVVGIGDASGMFPIDAETGRFSERMLHQFDTLTESFEIQWKLADILPAVLSAGKFAGALSEKGAILLDPSGTLKAGIPVCPPEGDAGTGMVATNSVARHSGNVSAGTSVFAMVVLEKNLHRPHPEIDLVTTPSGAPVAMVHCNNCTSDLNAWIELFGEFASASGMELDPNSLYTTLYSIALDGDADCGGLLSYNYLSGEPVTGFNEGRPLFLRKPDSRFSLANFMRTHLYASLCTLKAGMNILFEDEGVTLDKICGHGGFFRVGRVGQRIMAAALNKPVTVMSTAGEGGPWGMAILAMYMKCGGFKTLETYLTDSVFSAMEGSTFAPLSEDVEGFNAFMKRYVKGLSIEKASIDYL